MPQVEGVQHHYAVVNGLRMHYAAAGPDDGDPVVLVHGWPQHWYVWRRVIPLLADRFRIIAPDMRGFGWTDAPATSYAKTELGADIAGLLAELDLTGVRLAGHDWGGAAAFRAALAAPDRVRSLTVFAIVHPWARGKPGLGSIAAALAYQPAIAAPLLGPRLQRHTPFVNLPFLVSGGSRIWSADERRTFVEQFREPDRAEAASRVYRTFLSRELRERPPAERLQMPARLVLGRNDPIVTEALNAGAEEAGIEVEMIDAGHWIPESAPQVAADRIAGS